MTYDFATFHNRLTLKALLTLETGLRIGSGAADSVVGADIPVVCDALGRPYIPGSSFKGALRVTIERVARTINRPPVLWSCGNPLDLKGNNPAQSTCVSSDLKAALLHQATTGNQVNEQKFAHDLAERTCTVCSLFGSPWLAAKVRVKDLPLVEESWGGHVEVRNGVAIDRDTRTVSGKALYSFETVPAGAEFTCEIVAENVTDVELGLLLLGLKEMQAGRVPLGGARSRGLGWGKLSQQLEVTWVDQRNLLDYLTEGHTGQPPHPLDTYIKNLKQVLAEGGV